MNKPKPSFRDWVLKAFSDRFMTELAILLIPTTLLPLMFTFSKVSLTIFKVINLAIVVIFALEYVLKLLVSKPRWKYAIDPWHILDLLIILLAALDFAPFIQVKGLRASPLLRLLRLVRVFALTGRVVRRVTPSEDAGAGAPSGPAHFDISTETGVFKDAPREAVVDALAAHGEKWIDAHGLSRADIPALSSLFNIPAHILETKLLQDNFPGIDEFPGYTILTLWDSKCGDCPDNEPVPEIGNPVIVVVYGSNYIATLSKHTASLIDLRPEGRKELPGESYRIRILYSILRRKIDDYKDILLRLERTVAALEDATSATKPPRFLDTTFRLKKIIQKQGYNIGHFAQILDRLQKNSPILQKAGDETRASIIALLSEGTAIEDLCHNIRDNTTSLIELQLNKVSFDMNRVMKILAVITCLALVPAIIGGLLGQNLRDQPYDISIHEIFFFVISLMLIGLYVFYRKGWLK